MPYHKFDIQQVIDGDYASFYAICVDCKWCGRLHPHINEAIGEGSDHAERNPIPN